MASLVSTRYVVWRSESGSPYGAVAEFGLLDTYTIFGECWVSQGSEFCATHTCKCVARGVHTLEDALCCHIAGSPALSECAGQAGCEEQQERTSKQHLTDGDRTRQGWSVTIPSDIVGYCVAIKVVQVVTREGGHQSPPDERYLKLIRDGKGTRSVTAVCVTSRCLMNYIG